MLRYAVKSGKAKDVWRDIKLGAWLEHHGYPAWHYELCETDFCMN